MIHREKVFTMSWAGRGTKEYRRSYTCVESFGVEVASVAPVRYAFDLWILDFGRSRFWSSPMCSFRSQGVVLFPSRPGEIAQWFCVDYNTLLEKGLDYFRTTMSS